MSTLFAPAGNGTGSLHPRRRSVLTAGLAAPATLAGPAACGGDQESAPEPADTSADPGGGDPAAASAPPAAGTETVPAQLVPVGMAVYLESTNTVLTQPSEGDFRAFDATCPHQGCAVNQAVDGELECPCHASRFDLTSGDVLGGPAETGLTVRQVTLEGDELVVGEGR